MITVALLANTLNSNNVTYPNDSNNSNDANNPNCPNNASSLTSLVKDSVNLSDIIVFTVFARFVTLSGIKRG